MLLVPNYLLDRHPTVFPVSQSLRVEYGTKRIEKPKLKVRKVKQPKGKEQVMAKIQVATLGQALLWLRKK